MTPSPAPPGIEDSCQESLSDKGFDAFFDCVLLGGLDFFLGGSAVYFWMGCGFVAGAVLARTKGAGICEGP